MSAQPMPASPNLVNALDLRRLPHDGDQQRLRPRRRALPGHRGAPRSRSSSQPSLPARAATSASSPPARPTRRSDVPPAPLVSCAHALRRAARSSSPSKSATAPDVAVMLHGGPGASHDYLRPRSTPRRARAGAASSTTTSAAAAARRSTPARRPAVADEHVADLDAVRVHLGGAPLDARRLLVGRRCSRCSTPLAHPERVERLALISPAPACRARARRRQGAPRRRRRAPVGGGAARASRPQRSRATASPSPSPATSPIPSARSG